jgi:SAM-dependent methyltransferase
MTNSKYRAYYKFLQKNWDNAFAEAIIKTEMAGEEKYNIISTGTNHLKDLKKTGVDITHASIYMPVPYNLLELFFKQTNLSDCRHFLDIGCGKGRALCVAAFFGIKKISGIDFSKSLCKAAAGNIARIGPQFPKTRFQIVHNDAFYFKIEKDVDCILLFNPFDALILSGVLENIETSLKRHPRKISILYIHPVHKKMLFDYGYELVFKVRKMKYMDGIILQK